MERHASALLLCAAILPLACSKSSSDNPTPAATTAAPATAAPTAASTAAATASAAATTSAAAAKPDPPVYPPKTVPGGMLNGMFVQQFEIVRDKGNLGLSYLDAMNRCVGYGKALCTDSQWQRACDADAELAKIETWTASGVGNNKFVIRGGDEAGCRSRDIKDGAELSPTRATACCSPSISIKTTTKNQDLVSAMTRKLFGYQAAMRSQDTLTLTDLYADKVTFLGKERTNADIIKMHDESFKKDPNQWTMFDTCTIRIDTGTPAAPANADADAGADGGPGGGADGGTDATATADCRTLFKRGDTVLVAMQRLVWGGPGTKIKLIGDAQTVRQAAPDGTVIEEKEMKERVGILLSAD